jgi:VWFA-related protein
MSRTTLRAARLAAVAACALCAPAQPPFRQLHVVALDKSGQPVTDLTSADLKVSDDGKPQQILFLRLNDSKPAPPAPLGPREYSNQAGLGPGATIILFDLLNGSGDFSDRNFISGTILKALEKVENPASVFFYILTNKGALYPVHPIPKTPPAANAAEENWATHARALLDSAIQNFYGLRPIDQRIPANDAITTFHALHELASIAMALPGRKSIVWTTHAFPLQMGLGGECHDMVVENVKAPCTGNFVDFTPPARHLAAEIAGAGISIYPVDESESAVHVLAQEMLETFSGLTGGKDFPRGGTPQAVETALVAAHLNYTLGYQPAAGAKNWNGKFHKVKVACVRKDVQIQTEDGYVADAPMDQTAALIETAAMRSSDLPEIGLRVAVAPGSAPHTLQLKVKIGPSGVLLVPKDGRFTGELGFVVVGLTDQGPKQLDTPSAMKLNLTQAEYETAQKGISTTEEVPAPDSVHQVRVVVVDRWGNRVGSLTVPASL